MEQHTDDALVKRTLGGDRTGYDELVTRHIKRVHAYVRARIASVADAEELTQDAFVEAYLSLDRFRGGDFAAWCRGIARNLIRERARRFASRHETQLLEVCMQIEDELPAPSPVNDRLDECLGRIDEVSRKALDLFYNESRKLKDIARLLSKTISWVGVALHRSRKTLRLCLERNDGWRS